MNDDATSRSTLAEPGDAAPRAPDERCLWATVVGRRDVVVLGPLSAGAGGVALPSWTELDEVAEACWDASQVFAFGDGVLALAACGYARDRCVACTDDRAPHVAALGASPVTDTIRRCGRLTTARTWHALARTQALKIMLGPASDRPGPWLQRLREARTAPPSSSLHSAVAPSTGTDERDELARWVAAAAYRIQHRSPA